jgi:hypothetical protein
LSTNQELPTIAIPSVDCPLGPRGDNDPLDKVSLSASGEILYQSLSHGECGASISKATGPRAEQVKQRILLCEGPMVHEVKAPGLLGRLGLKKVTVKECPVIPVDTRSRRQLTEYFEGY